MVNTTQHSQHQSKEALPVEKDFSTHYNEAIQTILQEIDNIKKQLILDLNILPCLGERLNALYVKLTPKMQPQETTDYNTLTTTLNKIPIQTIQHYDNAGRVTAPGPSSKPINTINTKTYPQYRHQLEQIEIHLNKTLERIGLTNPTKQTKKRMS